MFGLWQERGEHGLANVQVFEACHSHVSELFEPVEHLRIQCVEADQTVFVDV